MDRRAGEEQGKDEAEEDGDGDGEWPPIVQMLCDGRSGPIWTEKDREEMAAADLLPLPDENDEDMWNQLANVMRKLHWIESFECYGCCILSSLVLLALSAINAVVKPNSSSMKSHIRLRRI